MDVSTAERLDRYDRKERLLEREVYALDRRRMRFQRILMAHRLERTGFVQKIKETRKRSLHRPDRRTERGLIRELPLFELKTLARRIELARVRSDQANDALHQLEQVTHGLRQKKVQIENLEKKKGRLMAFASAVREVISVEQTSEQVALRLASRAEDQPWLLQRPMEYSIEPEDHRFESDHHFQQSDAPENARHDTGEAAFQYRGSGSEVTRLLESIVGGTAQGKAEYGEKTDLLVAFRAQLLALKDSTDNGGHRIELRYALTSSRTVQVFVERNPTGKFTVLIRPEGKESGRRELAWRAPWHVRSSTHSRMIGTAGVTAAIRAEFKRAGLPVLAIRMIR